MILHDAYWQYTSKQLIPRVHCTPLVGEVFPGNFQVNQSSNPQVLGQHPHGLGVVPPTDHGLRLIWRDIVRRCAEGAIGYPTIDGKSVEILHK